MDATTPPISDEARQQVLALHAEGLGRNEISRRTGVSAGSVTNIIRAAGLTFDRAAPREATRARQDDLAEKRSRAMVGMYDQSLAILRRLAAPEFRTVLRGEMGVEETRTLEFVPPRDLRDLSDAASRLALAAARLEQVGNPQAERVKGLLGDIASQLGL